MTSVILTQNYYFYFNAFFKFWCKGHQSMFGNDTNDTSSPLLNFSKGEGLALGMYIQTPFINLQRCFLNCHFQKSNLGRPTAYLVTVHQYSEFFFIFRLTRIPQFPVYQKRASPMFLHTVTQNQVDVQVAFSSFIFNF